MTTPQTAKALIKGAARQRRKVRINLAGHLMAELETLEEELAELQIAEDQRPDGAKSRGRLGAKSKLVEKAEQIKAKQDEMAEFWLDLVIEQKSFVEWRQFKADNPPRDNDPLDDSLGVNFDKLVTDFTPSCVVEPEMDQEDWEGLFDKAAPGDLRDMGAAVFRMHEARLDIPLSRSASRLIARQDVAYEPPAPGE